MSSNWSVPHVAAESIGDAWFEGFCKLMNDRLPHRNLSIHITDPVVQSHGLPDSTEMEDWEPYLNVGTIYDEYTAFDFGTATDYEGTTGQDWIDSRLYELFEGLYHDRMTNPDQIQMITERLQQGLHGGCTNALVAQVFDVEDDLEVATSGRPFAKDMSCLTQLQFRPKKDELHLFATFRSQYLDTKAYGNLISLAMLLAQVCEKTGYEPGVLVERVNNTICMDRSVAKDLYNQLYVWKLKWDSDRYKVSV